MNGIKYTNSDNECFYDTKMLINILNVSKTKLHRMMHALPIQKEDYIIYKNLFLFREDIVNNFLETVKQNSVDKNDSGNNGM